MEPNKIKPMRKTYRTREARLTIDCSNDQKRKIKMIAASKDMSITDFMLSLVEEKFNKCPLGFEHFPNAETIESIEASERGEGLRSFTSMDNLFKDLGI